MLLIIAVIIIAGISFFLALRSLKQLGKIEKVSEVKQELKKGKVVFQSDSSSVSPESSK